MTLNVRSTSVNVLSCLLVAQLFLCEFSYAKNGGPQVKAQLSSKGGDIVISLENISDEKIRVGEISIADEDFSGLWLFMYDPISRENQLATAMTEHVIGLTKDNYPEVEIYSGRMIEKAFDKEKVLAYFWNPPECFFLTAVYRKNKEGGRLIFSRASTPIKICL